MSRIVLVHWNAAEAEERAARLRRSGHDMTCFPGAGLSDPRRLADDPPDVFLIDLVRVPSQGRAVAVWLRGRRATRLVPIVFVGGDREKTARVRALLPDATYTTWERIRDGLRRAISKRAGRPIVPGTMSAYAGSPLPVKLGIREGSAVSLIGAPPGFGKTLGRVPKGVRIRAGARGRSDVILLFARSRAEMRRRFGAAARSMAEGVRLWIVWRKKTSGVAGGLTQNDVRAFGLGAGLVDYKICAVDETWSGLCFARRGRTRGGAGAGARRGPEGGGAHDDETDA